MTTTASSRRANYTEGEIRGLIETYADLREKTDTSPRGLRFLVRLADLDGALERLPMKYWEVVLLHGLLGLPQDAVARILQVSQQAVSKRYRHGIAEAHFLMNGGIE